jgi:hypothetical protein
LPEKLLSTRPTPPQRRSELSRRRAFLSAVRAKWPWLWDSYALRPIMASLGLALVAGATLGSKRLLAAGAGLLPATLGLFADSAVAGAIATVLAQALTT